MILPSCAGKRRWFRFSLRTLFVVVTLLGLWLGYHVNWIRQRHDFLAVHDALHNGHPKYLNTFFLIPTVKPPGQLWLFGEEGVNCVVILAKDGNFESVRGLEREAERLFPETVVIFDVGTVVRAPGP